MDYDVASFGKATDPTLDWDKIFERARQENRILVTHSSQLLRRKDVPPHIYVNPRVSHPAWICLRLVISDCMCTWDERGYAQISVHRAISTQHAHCLVTVCVVVNISELVCFPEAQI